MRRDTTLVITGIIISVVVVGVAIPVLFYLGITALDRTLGLGPLLSTPVAYILTAATLVVGLFWVLWAYSYLLFVGQGSPMEAFGVALHPTKRLVTVGPYAYTRNPMILGYLWILLGISFYARSLAGIGLVVLFAMFASVYLKAFEEPALLRRFGTDYEHYRRHVPLLFPAWSVYIKPESTQVTNL